MRNIKNIACVVGISTVLGLAACAQTKIAAKEDVGGDYAEVIWATSQRHLPGLPEQPPSTNYKFVLVWDEDETPESFYWRAQDGWQMCRITKASYDATADDTFPYRLSDITTNEVKDGDTLAIIPVNGGKAAIPEGIPATATYTLFFKAEGSDWLSLPVKNIKSLPKQIER